MGGDLFGDFEAEEVEDCVGDCVGCGSEEADEVEGDEVEVILINGFLSGHTH